MKATPLDMTLPACRLGEGAFWDAREARLYWVDIEGCAIHRWDTLSRTYETIHTPSMPGFAVPDEAGGMVAGLQDGIFRINFGSGGSVQPVVRPQYAHGDNRFNDGKCDSLGRLWAGTMNQVDHGNPSGSFYRLDERGLHEQETGIYVSNGLGWSPDDRTMYYTDTGRRTVWAYDYDIETGAAVNRRDFLVFAQGGKPDGMCVDSEGRVYTALWGGWGVAIHGPDGKPEGKIDLPVPQVTSCAFGGVDLKTLYITTAAIGLSEAQMTEAPLAGHVFAVETDTPGIQAARYRG